LRGEVNGLGHGAVNGWLFQHDRVTGAKRGGQDVLVTTHGQPVAMLKADIFRPDVAEALGAEPNCGFRFVPPPETVTGQLVVYKFTAVPSGIELKGSPAHIEFPGANLKLRLLDMSKSIDALFTDLWRLKNEIKSLLPLESSNIHNYHFWALKYQALMKSVFSTPCDQDKSVTCP
jgi:hypothetical protein